MLENRMTLDEEWPEYDFDNENYLEHLYEEDDRRYEDEIFERLSDE